jgi:uncharacterized protein YkwD
MMFPSSWSIIICIIFFTIISSEAATTSMYTETEKQAILKQHNGWRCRHEASPLIWDDTLANEAQV